MPTTSISINFEDNSPEPKSLDSIIFQVNSYWKLYGRFKSHICMIFYPLKERTKE